MSFQSRAFSPQQSSSSSVGLCGGLRAVRMAMVWEDGVPNRLSGAVEGKMSSKFQLLEGYACMEMDNLKNDESSMNQSENYEKHHHLSRSATPWHHGH